MSVTCSVRLNQYNFTLKKCRSSVLKASVVVCRSLASIDQRLTLDGHLNQYSSIECQWTHALIDTELLTGLLKLVTC